MELLSLVSDLRCLTKSLRNVDAFRGLFCARLHASLACAHDLKTRPYPERRQRWQRQQGRQHARECVFMGVCLAPLALRVYTRAQASMLRVPDVHTSKPNGLPPQVLSWYLGACGGFSLEPTQ
jgi:uncharacterized CHY-type Zn-finger protein